jgi:PII-like signaling protein
MKIEGKAKKLTIYLGESDRWHHRPLYQALVEKLREHGVAGATALRGIEGFGKGSRIHTASLLRLSEDLPVLIQVVDREDRIASVLPVIDEMLTDGMVTIEDVDVITYRA